MAGITLVTGGAASGKSTLALQMAKALGERVLFVATCEARDSEMKKKVEKHRAERPSHWTTSECSRKVASVLVGEFDAAVVDCVTLLISQMLVDDCSDEEIFSEIRALAEEAAFPVIVVTNEVGLGLVPDSPLGRRFREIQGKANHLLAAAADSVVLVVSGLPLTIKEKA